MRVREIADTLRPREEGINAAFQVLGMTEMPEPGRMSRDHLTRQGRDKPARRGEHPALLLSYRG